MFLLGWSFSGAQESVGTEQMPRDGDWSELEPESDGGTRIKDVLEWNPREFWGISSRTGKMGSRSMSILLTKARGTTPMECFGAAQVCVKGRCESDKENISPQPLGSPRS